MTTCQSLQGNTQPVRAWREGATQGFVGLPGRKAMKPWMILATTGARPGRSNGVSAPCAETGTPSRRSPVQTGSRASSFARRSRARWLPAGSGRARTDPACQRARRPARRGELRRSLVALLGQAETTRGVAEMDRDVLDFEVGAGAELDVGVAVRRRRDLRRA